MKKNTYRIPLFGKTWELELMKGSYAADNNLAIVAVDTETGEEFTTVTVNLCPLDSGYAFIDTNNNSWAEAFLKKNGIAKGTGRSMSSGFCTYPLYRFNEDALNAMREIK